MKKEELMNNLKNVIIEGDVKKFEKFVSQKQYISYITKPYVTKGSWIYKLQFKYDDLKLICGNKIKEKMLMKMIDINNNKDILCKGESYWKENILNLIELEDKTRQMPVEVVEFLLRVNDIYNHDNVMGYFEICEILAQQILNYGVEHGNKLLDTLVKLKEEGVKHMYFDFQSMYRERFLPIFAKVGTLDPIFISNIINVNLKYFEEENIYKSNDRHLRLLLFMSYIYQKSPSIEAIKKAGLEVKNEYDGLFIFNDKFCFSYELNNKLTKQAFKEIFKYEFENDIICKDGFNYTKEFIRFWKECIIKHNPILLEIYKKNILNKKDYDILDNIADKYHLEEYNYNLASSIITFDVNCNEDIPIGGIINVLGEDKKFINDELVQQ